MDFFFSFCFLGPHPQYMEIPRLQVNQSCSCLPTPQPQQCQIEAMSAAYAVSRGDARSFNPLSMARDGIHILMDTSQVLNPLSHHRISHDDAVFSKDGPKVFSQPSSLPNVILTHPIRTWGLCPLSWNLPGLVPHQ